MSVPVMLSITYFFTDKQMDVDNIPKPISDALNGLAYFDDEQITDIICRKRYLGDDLRIETFKRSARICCPWDAICACSG